MDRKITVRGIGSVSVKPDTVVTELTLRSSDPDYEKAMAGASVQAERLQNAVCKCGFAAEDLKTAYFNVNTEYDSECDERGIYKSVFKGYVCVQSLKLQFDFDTALLGRVLSAISECVAQPELNIHFTVKDKTAVNAALLEAAAVNARTRAEILARASGVTLGELLSVNYGWNESDIRSRTEFTAENGCLRMAKCDAVSIAPEDIRMEDSAEFVWEIR